MIQARAEDVVGTRARHEPEVPRPASAAARSGISRHNSGELWGPRPRPTIAIPPRVWGEGPAAGRCRAGTVAWMVRDLAGSAALSYPVRPDADRKGGRGMSELRLRD